jgi:hypothetical protein
MEEKLGINRGKGFNILFPNGVCASVQWGPGNYTTKQRAIARMDFDGPAKAVAEGNSWTDNEAEVACWIEGEADNKWIIQELYPDAGDDVIGYLDPMQILEFLNKCANYKPEAK